MITTFRNVTSLWECHTSCNETQCQCAKAGRGSEDSIEPGVLAEPCVCWASSSPSAKWRSFTRWWPRLLLALRLPRSFLSGGSMFWQMAMTYRWLHTLGAVPRQVTCANGFLEFGTPMLLKRNIDMMQGRSPSKSGFVLPCLKPRLVTEFVISGYLQILVLSVGFFISGWFLFLVSIGLHHVLLQSALPEAHPGINLGHVELEEQSNSTRNTNRIPYPGEKMPFGWQSSFDGCCLFLPVTRWIRNQLPVYPSEACDYPKEFLEPRRLSTYQRFVSGGFSCGFSGLKKKKV